ncbi:MAG: hypothetical protein SFT81_06850 [Candidatus Caenarcaniphilales bacterium]|nr:hypothetical protein [Candidatus Caenarcaniphilales bacterium]
MIDNSAILQSEASQLTKEERTILTLINQKENAATEVMTDNDYKRIQFKLDSLGGSVLGAELSPFYKSLLEIQNPSVKLKEGVMDLNQKRLQESLEHIIQRNKPNLPEEYDLEEMSISRFLEEY